jgi:hypothetical protein
VGTAALQNDALTGSATVPADERSASQLSPVVETTALSPSAAQTAAFAIGEISLELSALPGAARLSVGAGEWRDTYVVDAVALAGWASGLERLATLSPAAEPREWADYRAPYLIDREGRPSVAFEAAVGDVVAYRLLVHGSESAVLGTTTSVEVVLEVAKAALGAAEVCGPSF